LQGAQIGAGGLSPRGPLTLTTADYTQDRPARCQLWLFAGQRNSRPTEIITHSWQQNGWWVWFVRQYDANYVRVTFRVRVFGG